MFLIGNFSIILGYIHLLTIYEKEILFIMILILCYSLIFVIINISKYKLLLQMNIWLE